MTDATGDVTLTSCDPNASASQVADATLKRAEAPVSSEQVDTTTPDPCRLVDGFA